MAVTDNGIGLPHFTNSTAAMLRYEPVYNNQFEVTFHLPGSSYSEQNMGTDYLGRNVQCIGSEELLLEQVKKVSGLPEITPTGTVVQHYKFADRVYANGGPEKTSCELTVEFEVNLANGTNDMYVYNTLRQWANIIYNPADGTQGIKRNYYGAMDVNMYTKDHFIYRRFEFKDVIMSGPLTAQELDYSNKEIYSCSAKFTSDWWTEGRANAYDSSDVLDSSRNQSALANAGSSSNS